MIAHTNCDHSHHKRNGKDRHGRQRYKCCNCGRRWTEARPRPIGDMRINIGRAEFIIRLLMEGTSVRTVERLTDTHRDTILELMVTVGENCRRFLRSTLQDIRVTDLQCDELWSFVGCKEKTRKRLGHGYDFGDKYCFIGVDRHTKLVLAWHVGDRDRHDAKQFINKLERAVDTSQCQISTDGWWPYTLYVPETFPGTDFGQVVKVYRSTQEQARYSPAQIIEARYKAVAGMPDEDRICTSHIERLNLSIRTQVRRFARLTNAFSKKLENHKAAMGLFFAHYNFCRKHITLKTTPAVAAGLAARAWSARELLEQAALQY